MAVDRSKMGIQQLMTSPMFVCIRDEVKSCCSVEPSTASCLRMGMKMNFDDNLLMEEGLSLAGDERKKLWKHVELPDPPRQRRRARRQISSHRSLALAKWKADPPYLLNLILSGGRKEGEESTGKFKGRDSAWQGMVSEIQKPLVKLLPFAGEKNR